MADPIEPTGSDDKAAKIAELQAKMAEAKAKREAAAAGGAVPAASAPATPSAAPAAPAGATDDKAAKLAELQAKMAAAKAKREAGGAGEAATATATATAAPAKDAIVSETDSKVAAMRQTIAEAKVREGVPGAQAKSAAAAAGGAGAPAAGKPKQTKSESDVGVWFLGRRSFMQSIGWMSFFGFLTIVILGAIRSMFPRVIYERPPVFKAGFPSDYVPGAISEKYKDEERVWIIRQTDGSFVALLAICTHLGCTPRWLISENKFKCPCHGSGFRGTPNWGVNFEGPAPRPLERVGIHLAPDGQIEIDKSKKFLWEKGQWEDPGATLVA